MRTSLLDSNVLLALTAIDHIHHVPAEGWLARHDGRIATCPITQGALVRAVMKERKTSAAAMAVLRGFTDRTGHEFWSDDLGFQDIRLDAVIGHRQVTDAYLAALARARGARVATLDIGFAALHGDVADLIPTEVA